MCIELEVYVHYVKSENELNVRTKLQKVTAQCMTDRWTDDRQTEKVI